MPSGSYLRSGVSQSASVHTLLVDAQVITQVIVYRMPLYLCCHQRQVTFNKYSVQLDLKLLSGRPGQHPAT